MQRHRLVLSGLVAFVLVCPSIFAQQRYTGISSDTLRVLVMNASHEAVPVSVAAGLKVALDPSSVARVSVEPTTVIRTRTEPIKWEYKFVHIAPGQDDQEAQFLNREGAQGWEMVGVIFSAANSATVAMKRPK